MASNDTPLLIFRIHAIQQMFARDISEVEVRAVLEDGEVIEENPDALPYPSRLVLGWVDQRPIHVLASHPDATTIVVITVYEPDRARWQNGFRRRKAL
jgi:hypothetical protein